MDVHFSESAYQEMIDALFCRFPSFQKVGAGAYKPGLGNMEFIDQLLGHPHKNYKVIHVAGTNGKGSVSNMLASVLSSLGYKVGLYTSPHILDFRERIRVCCHVPSGRSERNEASVSLIPKEDVWNFVRQWQDTFDHVDMSFFEITTAMALQWFADQKVDYVVLETGLGGRLDSTNIVSPVLSVITNIGLDHCDLLGETLQEVAFEKAGIIKPCVKVVVGESSPETDAVFERKVLYTNLPEPAFMGNRAAIMSLLTFADKVEPVLWDRHEEILAEMDLKGSYQRKNLRTVLATLDALGLPDVGDSVLSAENRERCVAEAIAHAAERVGFHGRWEQVNDYPRVICDIGHNEHGLKYNFAQLESMLQAGECTDLIILYGSVSDKDVDAVMRLMPRNAKYVFTQANGKRALPAEKVREKYLAFCTEGGRQPGTVWCCPDVGEAASVAYDEAERLCKTDPSARPLIYVGGSTYVVSEFISQMC